MESVHQNIMTEYVKNLLPPFAVKWLASWIIAEGFKSDKILTKLEMPLTAALGVVSFLGTFPELLAKVHMSKFVEIHKCCRS
jgi:hypothetical protein